MGKALHRKRVPFGRHPKTQGIGIGYTVVTPPAPRERTAEIIAARESERQKQAIRYASRRRRQWNSAVVIDITMCALDLWRKATDYTEQELANFPGWTNSLVCPLPVDASIARVYSRYFKGYSLRLGRELSLNQMDIIIEREFRSGRAVPTTQIVQETFELIRPAVEKHCGGCDIEIDLIIQSLQRRAAIANSTNTDIGSALIFVSKKISSMLDAAMKEEN